ncbi:MAG: diguanylate cyclase [Gemmatimonas sp. SM23_52]|nr:MAG: diguanylate cyclase [Gemmatimonas sp. SM23_52]
MMTRQHTAAIPGIHHVTALASDPRANLDFYSEVLGLRLVKRTVNFDDHGTYHLYYGDELGRPGTLLTFFPWPSAARGRRGAGQATLTSFRVPAASLGYWRERLGRLGVEVEGTGRRFDRELLTFVDPDGLKLELVASADDAVFEPWRDAPVAAEQAIRGFHGVTLAASAFELSARFLGDVMGFELVAEAGERRLFRTGSGADAAAVELVRVPAEPGGRISAGTVHHVAWRIPGDEEQHDWRVYLAGRGVHVTPVADRNYFRSIYFREPGGVLFEIATDLPGFTTDESREELGRELKLPPWLEPQRARIEATLPTLRQSAVAPSE